MFLELIQIFKADRWLTVGAPEDEFRGDLHLVAQQVLVLSNDVVQELELVFTGAGGLLFFLFLLALLLFGLLG